MKQKFYYLLLTALLGITGMNAWAQDYEISTPQDLVDFAEAVNSGETGANAVLTQDINLDGVAWTPIGNADKIYTGTFDGQGYAIMNFSYTATSDYNGLFGFIKDATVKNFSISGSLTSNGYTKNGVIGNANGTSKVSGIHSSLNITLANKGAHSGGIVGGDDGTTADVVLVEGCEYSGTMTHTGAGDCQAGILGYTGYGGVKNCIFSGTIIGETNTKYGGILGYTRRNNFLGVQNCLSIGKIVAPDGCTTAAAIIANYNGSATTTVKNNYYCLAEGSTTTLAIGNKTSSCEAPHAVTAEQLESGEVCYLLNGDQSNIAFYQLLGTDDVPSFDASRGIVYLAGHTHCDGTPYGGATGYSNTANVQDEHAFVDGFCSYCDALDGSYTMTPNADGYYEISSANLLRQFAILVNGGEYTANAILTADIDMTNKPWPNSIGDWQSSHMYKGKFDGKGFSITNLTFSTARDYHGLFGVVGENAEIKNFTIEGNVTVNNNSIGIVSYTRDNNVLISNIHSKLNFSGASGMRVGGIVGNANLANNVGTATIDRCTYSGTISVSGTGNYGGIVGYVNNNSNVKTTISNCLFDGKIINSGGAAECGGIAGYVGANLTQVTIKNCLSIGTVSATVSGQFFGAVKNKANSILNSYYQGSTINGSGSSGSVTPTTQDATEVDETQLMGGAICFALNDYQSEDVSWFQDLSGDDYPTPNGSDVVYPAGRQHCDGTAYTGVTGYSNTPSTQDAHDFVEGFCTYCNAFDETYMTANADGNFEIDTPNQLKWFAIYANEVDHAANAVLTDDIDLTGVALPSIGNTTAAYNGKFNGQGHNISGFEMTTAGRGGLFGDVTNATIQNFSISGNLTVTGGTGSGLIAWATSSTISNVHSSLVINVPNSGVHHVGGVVGSARGSNTIDRCSFSGSMTVADGSTDNFAGIVSYVTHTSETVYDNVINCANYGDITFEATGCAAGGVVGYVNSVYVHVKNCLNIGTITCTGGTPTFGGAIVGRLRSHTPAYLTNNFWYEDSAEGAGKANDGTINLESAESVTTEQLANGYVAARMAPYFRQNIGADTYPILNPTHNVVAEITAAGYATLYVPDTDITIPTGIEAFAGYNDGTYLQLTAINDAIAADEAVVLKGTAGIYSFVPTTGATKAATNELKGTAEDIEADGKYVLAMPSGEPVGFYKTESGTIKAGKAYLVVSGGSGVKGFTFAFGDDDPTSIKDLNDLKDSKDVIFNLAGQRMNKIQKGINIVDGKKILF